MDDCSPEDILDSSSGQRGYRVRDGGSDHRYPVEIVIPDNASTERRRLLDTRHS